MNSAQTAVKGRYVVVYEGECIYYSQSSNAYAHLLNIGKTKPIAGRVIEVHRTIQWENQSGLPPVDVAIGIDVEPVQGVALPVVPAIRKDYSLKELYFDDEYDYQIALQKDNTLSWIPRYCVEYEENYGYDSKRQEWFCRRNEAYQYAEWKRRVKNAAVTIYDTEGDKEYE